MAEEYTVHYAPTPKQRLFHASIADEVLFGGAAGGGKSKAIVMDALLRCLTYPRTHAYVFRRTYGELEDTVIREALSCYEADTQMTLIAEAENFCQKSLNVIKSMLPKNIALTFDH